MQALSHFSYHMTGGNYVLCDLQGGIYRRHVVLTDPVLLSRRRVFGVTDLGPSGITSFFKRHQCNGFCRREWLRPAEGGGAARHAAVAGTTMMPRRQLESRSSRPVGTASW